MAAEKTAKNFSGLLYFAAPGSAETTLTRSGQCLSQCLLVHCHCHPMCVQKWKPSTGSM